MDWTFKDKAKAQNVARQVKRITNAVQVYEIPNQGFVVSLGSNVNRKEAARLSQDTGRRIKLMGFPNNAKMPVSLAVAVKTNSAFQKEHSLKNIPDCK